MQDRRHNGTRVHTPSVAFGFSCPAGAGLHRQKHPPGDIGSRCCRASRRIAQPHILAIPPDTKGKHTSDDPQQAYAGGEEALVIYGLSDRAHNFNVRIQEREQSEESLPQDVRHDNVRIPEATSRRNRKAHHPMTFPTLASSGIIGEEP